MKTLNLGVEIDQGADFSAIIGIFGDGGLPIDITGYSFLGQMRESTDPAAPVVAEFQFNISNQDTNTGQVTWYLPEADIDELITSVSGSLQTSRLTTPYVFDVKMKDMGGVVTRIVQGLAYVSPQATQEIFP